MLDERHQGSPLIEPVGLLYVSGSASDERVRGWICSEPE